MSMDPFEPQGDGHESSGGASQDHPASAPQVPYPTPGPAAVYPEESKAVASLVLSILGLVACGLLSPVAWYFGHQEVKAIDEGRRDPTRRDFATAGKIIGIIGTLFVVAAIIFVGAFVIIGLSAAATG